MNENSDNNFYSMLQVSSKSKNPKIDDNGSTIQGKIKINGLMFDTVCDCAGGEVDDHSALTQCNPSKIKLQKNKDGKGAQFDDVRSLIGHPNELIFVNIADSHFSCLDGRITKPILGTPGGDAGEFILALHVYEGMLGFNRKLTPEAIDMFFKQYLKSMRQSKFYMCTDDTALEHIEKDSGMSMNIETLQNPQAANQEELLENLMKPDNIGCAHTKKMLKNPEFFSIRPELIKNFLTSFYKTLWDKNSKFREKLMLESLNGQHAEAAFLEIRANEACNTAAIAPLIKPSQKDKQQSPSIFVNHLDGASIRRHQLAKFFASDINHHQDPIDPEIMHHRMNKHGLAFLEVTGSYMAKYLPFYTLNLV